MLVQAPFSSAAQSLQFIDVISLHRLMVLHVPLPVAGDLEDCGMMATQTWRERNASRRARMGAHHGRLPCARALG